MSRDEQPLVLVVSPIPLYPLTGGGAARIWAYVDYLRATGFRVGVVTVPHSAADKKRVEARVDRLWIAKPRPAQKNQAPLTWKARIRHALPPAARHALRPWLFRYRRWRARLNGKQAPHVSNLTRSRNPVLDNLAAHVAKNQRPCAVITNFAWTARLLDKVPGGILTMLDTHDIQHTRATVAEEAGYELHRTFCTKEEEVAELERADILLSIQPEEMAQLRALCPEKEHLLVEHAFPLPAAPARAPEASKQILFVGNLYEPNVIGINDFIEKAWPAVLNAVPEATLHVCGRVCREVKGHNTSVHNEGVVPSLEPFYENAAVVINPVPFGTGLKIKSVEALSYGKALVTTPSGVTGLPPGDDATYYVRDIADMAVPIIQLLTDPARRKAMEDAAFAFAQQRFSPQHAFAALERRLREAAASAAETEEEVKSAQAL